MHREGKPHPPYLAVHHLGALSVPTTWLITLKRPILKGSTLALLTLCCGCLPEPNLSYPDPLLADFGTPNQPINSRLDPLPAPDMEIGMEPDLGLDMGVDMGPDMELNQGPTPRLVTRATLWGAPPTPTSVEDPSPQLCGELNWSASPITSPDP